MSSDCAQIAINGILWALKTAIEQLGKLHGRLGDFWWYSLMLFIACRAADLLNAFVGLWLVPKYVPPSELGAVLPLLNYASFLSLPIAVFSGAFRNEISGLAIRSEYGRLKTLMKGVFIASAAFIVLAITVSHFALPLFLTRIRIVEGSLGLLILFTSFVGALAPVYSNTLQALKKFRETSLINFLSAPIRLVTMLLTMPFRPIAGYFVGQAATPLFTGIAAVFSLRRELSVPAEPYWSREVVRRFGRLLALFAVSGASGSFAALVETTVLRQRLPEIDSAAYYMVTRFSDIASYLYSALVFALFPFSAELAARGKDLRPLLLKASAATTVFCAAAALLFTFIGRSLLEILPHGSAYAAYWWAIPWIIGINAINYIISFYATGEIAANRFGYMKFLVPLTLLYPAALLAVTGRGYFAGILPEWAMNALTALNATTLKGMLWWMTAVTALKLAGVALHACRKSAMPADKHSSAENL